MTTTPNETANAEATQLKSEWIKPELIQLGEKRVDGKPTFLFETNNGTASQGSS